jgi:hypothetical protein
VMRTEVELVALVCVVVDVYVAGIVVVVLVELLGDDVVVVSQVGVDDEVVEPVDVSGSVDDVVVSGQSSSGGGVSLGQCCQQVGWCEWWSGSSGWVQPPGPQSSRGHPGNWYSHSEPPRATTAVPSSPREDSAELVAVPTTTSAKTMPATLTARSSMPDFSVNIAP